MYAISILEQDDISPTKRALLWSRVCFKILRFVVMQCVARVCQCAGLSATAELLVSIDATEDPTGGVRLG